MSDIPRRKVLGSLAAGAAVLPFISRNPSRHTHSAACPQATPPTTDSASLDKAYYQPGQTAKLTLVYEDGTYVQNCQSFKDTTVYSYTDSTGATWVHDARASSDGTDVWKSSDIGQASPAELDSMVWKPEGVKSGLTPPAGGRGVTAKIKRLGCHNSSNDYPNMSAGAALGEFDSLTGLNWGLQVQKFLLNPGEINNTSPPTDLLSLQGAGARSFILTYDLAHDGSDVNALAAYLKMLKNNNVPIFAFTPDNECNGGSKFTDASAYANYVNKYASTIQAACPMSFIGAGSDITGAASYAQACINLGIKFDYIGCDFYYPTWWHGGQKDGTNQPLIDVATSANVPYIWPEWGATNNGSPAPTAANFELFCQFIVNQLNGCDWALCCYWNTNVAQGADNTIEPPNNGVKDWKIPGLQIVANGLTL